jgi:histidyl-tRNA synthetase
MPVQPRTPPGVLELLPPQQIAFQRMLDTIRRGFERFGYLPIETPAFELTDVLLTKSGGETEKQVMFVQSTGDLDNAERARAAGEPVPPPKHALRFDLTVPLARYVAEHEHELAFPFRRYQIQRAYRGERPQRGRYREFYQCDIDVIGKDTLPLAYDAELPAVIHGIFTKLDFGSFGIHINNRKLLRGLLEDFGIEAAKHADVLGAIDRLPKEGRDKVAARLTTEPLALDPKRVDELLYLIGGGAGDSASVLEALDKHRGRNATLDQGIDELRAVWYGAVALGVPAAQLRVDLSIARGLDYYTGTVYETFLDAHRALGSICSGGRYDDLAGHYTKSKLPGVGMSIGVTRLLSAMLEDAKAPQPGTFAQAFERLGGTVAQVLVLRVEPTLAADYAQLATRLRNHGLNVELYGGDDKLAKQFKYADRARVPLALIYGSREAEAGNAKVKDLRTATEHEVPLSELEARVAALLP